MNKINLYLFKLTNKYIFLNLFLVSIIVIFINLIEISRLLENFENKFFYFFLFSVLKLPVVLNDVIPFVIIIAISFLCRNLINNNEFIAMRNIGYSIFDIFLPIGLGVLTVGLFFLIIVNPISVSFSEHYNKLSKKEDLSLYSINIENNEMWIKNKNINNNTIYINLKNIDLKKMKAEKITILEIKEGDKKVILANKGQIDKNIFFLDQVKIYNIYNEELTEKNTYKFQINFNKENIINSITNFKSIPFYDYIKHTKTLNKFNLYSPEIGLFYFSEILKPLFIVTLAFLTIGFSGKFTRNESFFKVLFISILMGFLIFLFKEIINKLTIMLTINFVISYSIIFFVPFIVGLYQFINIEND